MKATGIIRKIDELGRVVLPNELRRSLGLEEKAPLEIGLQGEYITLSKPMGSGVARKLDRLGRIVLPVSMRKRLGIQEGTPLEIFTDGETIVLKKYNPACIFCGRIEDTTALFKGKLICGACRKEIIEMDAAVEEVEEKRR